MLQEWNLLFGGQLNGNVFRRRKLADVKALDSCAVEKVQDTPIDLPRDFSKGIQSGVHLQARYQTICRTRQ